MGPASVNAMWVVRLVKIVATDEALARAKSADAREEVLQVLLAALSMS